MSSVSSGLTRSEPVEAQGSFQGARYETYAAAVVRADLIRPEGPGGRARTHCEFTATHRARGAAYSVEAKSRDRPGFLGQPGDPKPARHPRHCPVARALAIIGNSWTILILRGPREGKPRPRITGSGTSADRGMFLGTQEVGVAPPPAPGSLCPQFDELGLSSPWHSFGSRRECEDAHSCYSNPWFGLERAVTRSCYDKDLRAGCHGRSAPRLRVAGMSRPSADGRRPARSRGTLVTRAGGRSKTGQPSH
jgi:hypothetical protein